MMNLSHSDDQQNADMVLQKYFDSIVPKPWPAAPSLSKVAPAKATPSFEWKKVLTQPRTILLASLIILAITLVWASLTDRSNWQNRPKNDVPASERNTAEQVDR